MRGSTCGRKDFGARLSTVSAEDRVFQEVLLVSVCLSQLNFCLAKKAIDETKLRM